MQKINDWLTRHGAKLLVALSALLLSSGIVGQLRGRHAVLVTDHNLPSQVKYSPVWWLYFCAAVPLLILLLTKRRTRK